MPIDYIEITDPDSDDVAQFHNVLVEAFPHPREREDVGMLRESLRRGSWTSEDERCRYHLVVARRNDQVVGGMSFYFFCHRDSYVPGALGIGSYLAVKKDFRKRGIGTNLIAIRDQILAKDAGEFDCYLKGLVIQVNDPGLMSAWEIEQDSINSWERERFWKRRGYEKIAFNFIQPPIRSGEPPIEYLSLYVLPYCLKWKNMARIPVADLQYVVYCFIKCTGTPGPSESDPSYLRMKSELAKHECFPIL